MALRTISVKSLFLFLFLFALVYAGFLLIGPRIPEDPTIKGSVTNVNLPGPFGVSLDCDSFEFMKDAQDPALLLEPKSCRQSRPGLIFAANIVSYPFVPLKKIIHGLLPSIDLSRQYAAIGEDERRQTIADLCAVYVAYSLLNLVFILFSAKLLIDVWGQRSDVPLVLAFVSTLVMSNDIVKFYFWSPHTQVFNVFVPLLCIWFGIKSWNENLVYQNKCLWLSLLAGVGMTAYGSFVTCLPFIMIPALFKKPHLWLWAKRAFAISFAFFLPSIAWFSFVCLRTGAYYQAEMEKYGALVWLKETNGISDALVQIGIKITIILKIFFIDNWLLCLVIAVLFGASKSKGILRKGDRTLIILSFSVCVVMALAQATFAPFIIKRGGVMLLPPLYALLGLFILRLSERSKAMERIFTWGSGASLLAWAAYVLIKPRPSF